MDLYINGISAISPQKTFKQDNFLTEPVNYTDKILKCINPDYKQYINPRQLRRMSNVIRMGITTAKDALQQAENPEIDGIITGTGIGCETDTEKFLKSIDENNESLLTPTAFIQSTHNTVGSQIALMLNCKKYNMNYVNKVGAFESALLDAELLFNDGVKNILVGGLDEMTTKYHYLRYLLDFWKKETINSLKLFDTKTKATIAGEGAVYALLSNQKSKNTLAKYIAATSFINLDNTELNNELNEFLKNNNLTPDDISVFIGGNTGDVEADKQIDLVYNNNFPDAVYVKYKHLTGEYDTSSAFAFWLAANIIKRQEIPDVVNFSNKKSSKIKYVLIYNYHYYFKNNHNFILLSDA